MTSRSSSRARAQQLVHGWMSSRRSSLSTLGAVRSTAEQAIETLLPTSRSSSVPRGRRLELPLTCLEESRVPRPGVDLLELGGVGGLVEAVPCWSGISSSFSVSGGTWIRVVRPNSAPDLAVGRAERDREDRMPPAGRWATSSSDAALRVLPSESSTTRRAAGSCRRRPHRRRALAASRPRSRRAPSRAADRGQAVERLAQGRAVGRGRRAARRSPRT